MLTGFVLPGGSAAEQLEQAALAEQSGWDGVFVPEIAYGVDAWSLLAAMAARTERIRLGTLLTPLPWRRPWKVASQVATVDQISGGRAILAVGIGAVAVREWLTGHGATPGLDLVAEGGTPADDQAAAAAHVTPWARAGCTWWIENRWHLSWATILASWPARDCDLRLLVFG